MTEPINQSVSIDDLREALDAAEQQMAAVREQMRACESRLRELVGAGLTDAQQGEMREQIRAEHRALIEQQRMIEEWIGRLKHVIENFELRIREPEIQLKRATSELAAIDERLDALNQQAQAVQADREVALLHVSTAQAAIDAVTIEMPERPLYPTPARVVQQIGMPTEYRDSQGSPVTREGAPIAPGS